MKTDAVTGTEKTVGLYLHVPFCAAKCRYCDFYSAPAGEALKAAYLAALTKDIAATAPRATGYTVDTVYIGGGTPTVLPPEALAALLLTVRRHYTLAPDAEITVECNPVTNAAGLFEGLLAAGVNRLSIGLQSALDGELRALGRPHSFADFTETFGAARRAGLENISVDVMFGIPHQTKETLSQTLAAVLALSPAHISAYGLRVEEGTPFFAVRDTLPIADDDTVADMQLLISRTLCCAGYLHYEISNYAREGRRARHNMRYWLSSPYLGFGPGAHSYFAGERYAAPRDTKGYIAAVQAGDIAYLKGDCYTVDRHEAREEYVMLRMRLFEGIDEADFHARFGLSFEEAYGSLDRLVEGGFLTRQNGRIAFTEKGMYVSNTILSEWLDFS